MLANKRKGEIMKVYAFKDLNSNSWLIRNDRGQFFFGFVGQVTQYAHFGKYESAMLFSDEFEAKNLCREIA